jgi:pSer/pThr/pTyr-binding forkhead associated (FHA) protein
MTTTSGKRSVKPRTSSLESQLERVGTQPGVHQGRACLVVSTGEAAGAVFPLTDPVVLIGRSAEAKVRIDEHAISNSHALLETDGAAFTLRDLDSTNGTFVNGQRIVQKVVLAGGDTIEMGSTTFLFLIRQSNFPESNHPDATMKLDAFGAAPSFEARRSRSPSAKPPALLVAPADDPPSALSLTDVVATVRRYWGYVRRYGWLAVLFTCLGVAAGTAHARFKPPPGSAWFEMKLVGARPDDPSSDVLVGVENTFRSLPLIKKALSDLGVPTVGDATASVVQARLILRRMGYNSNVYRGEYDDVSAERAALFLNQLVQVYIESELDKLLQVLRMDAEFDRAQEAKADERVAAARGRLIEFSDAHPEAVPKDKQSPEPVPSRGGNGGTSAARNEEASAALERQLRAAYARIQTQKAAPYVEQAAAVETKITEARARGLKDQHPELANLLDLQKRLRAKIDALLAAEPSPTEQIADPEVARLQQALTEARRRTPKSGATASGGKTTAPANAASNTRATRPARVKTPPGSLSQLRIEYSELSGEYERAKTEHDALMKKRETTDRQLERERISAKARYDIITPPTPAKKSAAAIIAKRAGAGGVAGLILALLIAAGLELRRVLISRGHI